MSPLPFATRPLVITCAVLSSIVSATAAPSHVRGVIASVQGSAVTIKTDSGKSLGLTLDDSWKIGGVVPATLADVTPGTFIGTANVEAADGNTALEVVVFPEAMRGAGEGNYAWDLKPDSKMTNATVSSAVQAVNGRTVKLSFKGGEKTVTIPENVPIVKIAGEAGPADVKTGSRVFAVGDVNADETMMSGGGRLVVGKDGAVPPM